MKISIKKCRTCLEKKKTLNNIFSKKDSILLSTQLMSISKVNIYPNDGLPDTICDECLIKLENCWKFIKQCEESELELRSILSASKTKEEITINENIVDGLSSPCNSTILIKPKTDITSNCPINKNHNAVIKNETDNFYENIDQAKNEKKLHQCSTCGKVLSTRYRLKTHFATHLEEKPFSCQHCEKRFSVAQNLKVHLRTHTGEKPLECSVCGKKFAHTAGLITHKRKHDGQTPYQCVLCPRSFRTVGHLQYHVRIHTGERKFECGICSRAFITRSCLKTHYLIHTGEKSHVCSICEMRFSRASSLSRHVRCSHIKDKQFSCSQCLMKFIFNSELNRHKKKHKDKINDS